MLRHEVNMGSEGGLKIEMLSRYDDMTPVERGIADFFVKNEELRDFSSRKVSGELYTSEATLSRFAKKCGYKGYREFIFAYENEIRDNLREHNIGALTKKVRGTYTQILDKSFRELDEKQIKRISGLMSSKSKVIVIGLGNSGFAAKEFELRFMRLGTDVRAVTDSQIIPMTISLCDENSLVIAISLSGTTKEIIDAVHLAKTKGSATVMITADKDSKAGSYCDELILASSVRNLDEGTMISPQFPVLIIIDVLYIYYLEHDAQRKSLNYRRTLLALRGITADDEKQREKNSES